MSIIVRCVFDKLKALLQYHEPGIKCRIEIVDVGIRIKGI